MYHAHCADGFGAAFAAWKKFGAGGATYLPVSYGDYTLSMLEFDHEFLLNREVYILDFSFPREVMDLIFKVCTKVVWLDHHKTAFELYEKHPNTIASQWYDAEGLGMFGTSADVVLDNTRSGALIAWNYFHPQSAAPRIIYHIDDYDRWQFKLLGTKEFNKALWAYTPWTFEFFNDSLNSERVGEMISEGAAILKAHEQNVDGVIAASELPCTVTWFEQVEISHSADLPYKRVVSSSEVGAVGLAANCPAHLTSDVGHKLATKSGTYGLCWFQRADSKINCSLRSNGDYDVSAIAKRFGGGGHKNAAGFTLGSMGQLQRWFYPDRRSI
jgi:oligoribonuclease NrnB/cAMP/cGMP phosphodiesterase (DHH superfamily)